MVQDRVDGSGLEVHLAGQMSLDSGIVPEWVAWQSLVT